MLDSRATEFEIQGHAVWSASRVRTLLHSIGKSSGAPETPGELIGRLNGLAIACQAVPANADTLGGIVARMTDASWWTRNLRRELLRENEATEHAAGEIHKSGQVYVSNHAATAKRQRRKANRATLENLEVVNENGEAFNLQEVADSSVSNPALRRAELMVRCRGFEEVAEFHDHTAIFLTMTCPSRFHRAYHSGADNKKWDGSTPKQAKAYLQKTWEKTRAAWKRAGAMPYGFRVAEPHHDGTPHWHVLLFMPADHVAGVVAIARKYFCADSPTERGMKEHRFTVKFIDPEKGSATGYIAKYISKNIDGEKEGGGDIGQDDEAGVDATGAAIRVKDWASVWGIRQFQQVGGPSVTVWREMRRMREPIGQQSFNFEGVRQAADESLWSMFWMLQGGPGVKRSDLSIKPVYVQDSEGKYGEEVYRVWGVAGDGVHFLQTRLDTWTVQRAGLAVVNELDAEHRQWVTSNRKIREFERLMGVEMRPEFRDFEPDPIDHEMVAWTGVNNCTPPPDTYHGNAYQNAIEVQNAQAEQARIDGNAELLRKVNHDRHQRTAQPHGACHQHSGQRMGQGTHAR